MTKPSEAAWEITRRYLIDRRDDLGLTNYRLSKDTGISESTVKRIFDGTMIPSVVIYFQLLTGLQLNPHLVPKEVDDFPYPKLPEIGDH